MEESCTSEVSPDRLRSLVTSKLCLLEYDVVAERSRCMTHFGGIQLQGIGISRFAGFGSRNAARTPHHIRTDRADDFQISMPTSARVTVSQAGTTSRIEHGSFMVVSTLRPFLASITADCGCESFSSVNIKVSGSLLRQRVPKMDDWCGRLIKVRPGAGKIMETLIESVLANGNALSERQAHRVSMMLIDAIANATLEAPELAQLQETSRLPASARVRECALSYIECNLSNRALDATLVAEHCRVSMRYLRAVFELAGTTMGSCIREARLKECKAALQNPGLRHRSVFEIALNWGFDDPANFSRVYKARYGTSPSKERTYPAA